MEEGKKRVRPTVGEVKALKKQIESLESAKRELEETVAEYKDGNEKMSIRNLKLIAQLGSLDNILADRENYIEVLNMKIERLMKRNLFERIVNRELP